MAPGPTLAAASGLLPRGDLAGRRRHNITVEVAAESKREHAEPGEASAAPRPVDRGPEHPIVSGDGNGWVICSRGHRHWGRFGAAGILLTDGHRVVLQHRAEWTHEGGTWAVPGGARDSHENAVVAALREAVEETTLDPSFVTPFAEWIDEHGGWSYTTVLAEAPTDVDLAPANAESVEIEWWSLDRVDELPLHAGFAAAWPRLRELIQARPQLG